jgi:hypothetical protein
MLNPSVQETLAVAPLYDPPVAKFEKLYGIWSGREQQVPMFGLIITGTSRLLPI